MLSSASENDSQLLENCYTLLDGLHKLRHRAHVTHVACTQQD